MGERIVRFTGVKNIIREATESINLGSYELIDTELTTRKPA